MMKEDRIARLRYYIEDGKYTVQLPTVMSNLANCPSCSQSVSKDWTYCPHCARNLPTEIEVDTSVSKYNDDLREMQSKFFDDCWGALDLDDTLLSQEKVTNLILEWHFFRQCINH